MSEPDDVHGSVKYDPDTNILTIRRVLARYKGKPYEVVNTYGVTTLDPDPSIGSPAIRLTKADGSIYDVIRTPHGYECSCPDGTYRRANSPSACKHTKALQAVGLLPLGR